ncbi:kelch-like protein 25 [Drosophila subpulchrella]|uniref:kelch-like protein 25 n=1 Tax=Drosophila subpulchrella TaxID=1486046 RepID=UPI0018A12C59|nr:kelch-like protein 25 [Drosophila subpulchrella]
MEKGGGVWAHRGSALRKRGLFSDINIRVESSVFQCHKIVLASASEFFEILLQKEGLKTGEVILQDTTPQVFEIFLDFIYTKDKCPLKQTKPYVLLSLLKCANMWLACEVQQVCESTLLGSSMAPKEWIQLYAVSFLLDNKLLMSHAIQLLQRQNHFDCPEFMELELHCFVEYFSCTKDLDQLKRFTMLDMWLQKNIPKEHRVLHMNNGNIVRKRSPSSTTTDHDKITVLLDSIDFERMSLDDFYKGPAKSNLLTESAKIELMYKMAKRGHPHNRCYRNQHF